MRSIILSFYNNRCVTMHPHIQQIPDHNLILSLIRVFFPTARIILYGSRARGTNTERSDVDIAIDAGTRQSIHLMAQVREVLEGLNTLNKIDLVDFNGISEQLRQQITQDGITWEN